MELFDIGETIEVSGSGGHAASDREWPRGATFGRVHSALQKVASEWANNGLQRVEHIPIHEFADSDCLPNLFRSDLVA